MFEPGVQVVMVKDSAARRNAVFLPEDGQLGRNM
jgi:hypothetical protein